MKAFYRKWLGSRLEGETGFTLVELLVVVGIIVVGLHAAEILG